MGSGKRASMREGPLAALFRKTETEGLEPARRRAREEPPRSRAEPPAVPERGDARRRRRSACATRSPPRCPRDMMAPPDEPTRRDPPPAADDYQWGSARESAPGTPQLRVVGVGGGGVNAVNRMIEAEVGGVEFIALNTDAQSLQQSRRARDAADRRATSRAASAPARTPIAAAPRRWRTTTASSPCSRARTWCSSPRARAAAPAPARRPSWRAIARELGALTVGIVTKPFGFEGSRRLQAAETGIKALAEEVDTLIVVPNNRLLSVLDKQTSMVEAFRVADDVLRQGVQGISDLITLPGLINLDFADVRTIMSDAGNALLGIGMGTGEKRAVDAAAQADVLAAAGDDARGRASRSCCRSPAAATCRCGRSTRPPAPCRRPRTRTRTSSSARWSTRSSRTRCGSPSSPRATSEAAPAARPSARRCASRSASRGSRARASRSARPARGRSTSTCPSSSRASRAGASRTGQRWPMRGVVAAGHPLTAAAGADVLRAGGNAVDAALAALMTSFMAEPLLTGLGAGGYMLVAPPGGEPVLLDFLVEAAAAAHGERAAAGRGRDRLRRRRPGLPHRRRPRAASTAPRRGSPRRPRASAPMPLAELARARGRARPRRRRGQRARRRTCARSSRRSPSATRGVARAATCSTGARRARATCMRDPALADALERLAAEGAAPFYTGDIAAAVVGLGRRARRHADARGPRGLRDDPARAGARRATAAARCSPTRRRARAALLIAYALALLERGAAARRTRRELVARDGGRAGRAHAGVPRRPRTSRASWRRSWPSRLGSTTHISVLDADGWACAVTMHQRRGLRDRRARHRHPRQQHDGRAGPLARGLVHAPAGPPAAVDDGADGRARRRARRSSCSAPPAPTGSARRSCR